jgi:hypothetical protein
MNAKPVFVNTVWHLFCTNCIMRLAKSEEKRPAVSKRKFFLKKREIMASTRSLLETIYPTVDWGRVDFYEGLPWFSPLIAPYVTAQALPAFYSFGRFRIYLLRFDEERAQCLSDIVHEGFHILQAMQFAKGYGFGLCRGFTIYYTALFVKHGYRYHPFEVPAYDQEYRFLERCEEQGIHGIKPKVSKAALGRVASEPGLMFRDFPYRYRENRWRLAAGVLFCSLLALLFPLVELVALPVFAINKLIRSVSSGRTARKKNL